MNKLNFSKEVIELHSGGSEVIILGTVDSTNTYAKTNISDLRGGSIIIAYEQTAGRGRQGKKFFSPDMGGLYMSIVLEKNMLAVDAVKLLTVCTSVAVCRAIKKVCNISPGIKWVNDIFFDGRKVCGILCESVNTSGDFSPTHYIVGIGINLGVSCFPDEIKKIAGSIPCAEGAENMLAGYIAKELFSVVSDFDGKKIIEEYSSYLMMLGSKVNFAVNGKEYHGTAHGINEYGNLIVKCDEGEMILSSGEISLGSSGFVSSN